MPIISILRKLRQEEDKFEESLGYIVSSRSTWATQRDCLSEQIHTQIE